MIKLLKKSDGALAEDLRRIVELFRDAPGGMIVTEGPDHVVAMMNKAYRDWIGGREVTGRPVRISNQAPFSRSMNPCRGCRGSRCFGRAADPSPDSRQRSRSASA